MTIKTKLEKKNSSRVDVEGSNAEPRKKHNSRHCAVVGERWKNERE